MQGKHSQGFEKVSNNDQIAGNPSEHRIWPKTFRTKHKIPTKNSSSLALDLNSCSQAIAAPFCNARSIWLNKRACTVSRQFTANILSRIRQSVE